MAYSQVEGLANESYKSSVFPQPCLRLSVACEGECAEAMSLVFFVHPTVLCDAIGVRQNSVTFADVANPIALVHTTIRKREAGKPCLQIVLPLTLIHTSITVCKSSITVPQSMFEETVIHASVGP